MNLIVAADSIGRAHHAESDLTEREIAMLGLELLNALLLLGDDLAEPVLEGLHNGYVRTDAKKLTIDVACATTRLESN